jgi:hypothetical protein
MRDGAVFITGVDALVALSRRWTLDAPGCVMQSWRSCSEVHRRSGAYAELPPSLLQKQRWAVWPLCIMPSSVERRLLSNDRVPCKRNVDLYASSPVRNKGEGAELCTRVVCE